MAKLSREQVLKLAHLSRLKLTEAEIKRFQIELAEILDYVNQLDNVDTAGLTPTYQVSGLKNVMRDDEVINYQAKVVDLLKSAPALEKNQYKVKRVL